MISKKTLFLTLTITVQLTTRSFSQSLPQKTVTQIDSLYTAWNSTSSPGCTIGIVRDDTLIYSKGYGMANLEHDINNRPETVFHVASISKQFTAWSILLLARQGKLNLDDDIHKYLPWFPDLKAKITVRNLLNHTSGIRDQWQLVAIAGTRLEDVITQDQIIKILTKQLALNFIPGDEYNYTSSGYTMLAEIVKSATGKTFRQFTDSAIFKPLKMINTHFHDDVSEIEKNRASSYNRIDETHFSNSILSYSTVGATSLFTNVVDLSKWMMKLYAPGAEDQVNVKALTQNVTLNSNEKLSYACGIVVNTYKGWKQYSHAGSDAGYRTYMAVFPDKKMGFIVFSNVGDFDPDTKVHAMADIFIQENKASKSKVNVSTDSQTEIAADTMAVVKFAGDYIGDDGLPLSFDIKDRKLYYNLFNQSSLLRQDSKNSFSIAGAPEVRFIFSSVGNDIMVDVKAPDQFYHLKKYTKNTIQSVKTLQLYVGTYFSPELDCKYNIILKDNQLSLTSMKYDSKLTFLNNDHLMNDNWWMSHLTMLRDKNNNLTGFEVNSFGVKHLRFNKLKN